MKKDNNLDKTLLVNLIGASCNGKRQTSFI